MSMDRVNDAIKKAFKDELTTLDLSFNKLTALPEGFGQLTSLTALDLSFNELTALPEGFGQLTNLTTLNLGSNKLTALPEGFEQLTNLTTLHLNGNKLTALPEGFEQLTSLTALDLRSNELTALPEGFGQLTNLTTLNLGSNKLTALPEGFEQLTNLTTLNLNGNELHPDLVAAYDQGIESLFIYLKAVAKKPSEISEVKLIVVGEGNVGKSCLVDALAGLPWMERESTHGIRIEPFSAPHPDTGETIHFNSWDFGGQPVYRPTHQLFFSAPALYLVVWKPREGSEQNHVEYWIRLIKLREPKARILVVATHGGAGGRLADIDRQDITDYFGTETVRSFHHVNSKPDENNVRAGIQELLSAILAESGPILNAVGRDRPAAWENACQRLRQGDAPYVSMDRVKEICESEKMTPSETRLFLQIWHQRGHFIHYENDPLLESIVIMRPDWLTQAISYVLDDAETRNRGGLIGEKRLAALWNDPNKGAEFQYDPKLHAVFRKLMERFDLAYPIVRPPGHRPVEETLLVAQLVTDLRPEDKIAAAWPPNLPEGESESVQVCRVVTESGESARAEGLFYQLIVRLYKFSLGRMDFDRSVHWQRGLIVEDGYNGRARLDHIGNDIRITVRAADPKTFLSMLTHEVKWLVENFWEGLECRVTTPCIDPCGLNRPGAALYEIPKLIEIKKRGNSDAQCPNSRCEAWQNVDALLNNLSTNQRPTEAALIDRLNMLQATFLQEIRQNQSILLGRFDDLDLSVKQVLSQVDAHYTSLLRLTLDEAKEGPRLFSFKPVETGFLDDPKWIAGQFELTLWCEHSQRPLPLVEPEKPGRGVYRLKVTRDWFVKSAPYLKVMTTTLGLVLPVAAASTKLLLDSDTFKEYEDQLSFGEKMADSALKADEKLLGRLEKTDEGTSGDGKYEAQDGSFRWLQAILKLKDPTGKFGELVRVRNNKNEFLWVHEQYKDEYPSA